jgi:hypothetical protein
MGWAISHDREQNLLLLHHGRYFGFNSLVYFFPQLRLSVVMLQNQTSSSGSAKKVVQQISRLISGEEYQVPVDT